MIDAEVTINRKEAIQGKKLENVYEGELIK